jgi:hypothetical protein
MRSLTRGFKRLVGLKRQMATVQLHGDYVQLLHAVSQISSYASHYNGHGRLAIDLSGAKVCSTSERSRSLALPD